MEIQVVPCDESPPQVNKKQVELSIISDDKNPTSETPKHDHHFSSLISLPKFVSKIHAGHFRITLSLGWQTLLWKVIILQYSTHQEGSSRILYSTILTVAWSFSLFALVVLSLLYALKCVLSFKTIKAEFMHHVGVNYLFAPWISWLVVLESAPFVAPDRVVFVVLWWIFAVPVVVLDVVIYGQWFTKGKRFLSAVANPTSQLTVIGNLVGARAAAKMDWKEISLFLFSLGIVHYLVLFVTLYQRLSGTDPLPAMLRPVFSLFFAAPSIASLAWYSISGSFDTGSKMLFFLSLFLFASLACRPALFKKSMRRYNVAWWAYSYPITILALASTRYAQEVKGGVPLVIRLSLSLLSVVVLFALLLFTAYNPKLLLADDDHLHDHDHHHSLLITTTTSSMTVTSGTESSSSRSETNNG